MLAVGGTVELGLDIDAGRGGEGEAMPDVDITFGRRCERRGLRVDGSGIGWFYAGVGYFADGLLELGRGEGFRSGQGGVALASESVDGFTAGVAGGDLSRGCDLEGVFRKRRRQCEGTCARSGWRGQEGSGVRLREVGEEEGDDLSADGAE